MHLCILARDEKTVSEELWKGNLWLWYYEWSGWGQQNPSHLSTILSFVYQLQHAMRLVYYFKMKCLDLGLKKKELKKFHGKRLFTEKQSVLTKIRSRCLCILQLNRRGREGPLFIEHNFVFLQTRAPYSGLVVRPSKVIGRRAASLRLVFWGQENLKHNFEK